MNHSCSIDLKPGELDICRSFSMKNMFGPVLKYQLSPNSVSTHNVNLQLALRLQSLLQIQTFVEEFAIC